MTIDLQAIKNRMATQQAAQGTQQPETGEQAKQADPVESAFRVFHGEFTDFQQYLTNSGKVVSFYRGYCMTDDPEIIDYCTQLARLKQVQEVTGKVLESDVPVAPKRERNRNWASAQGSKPHVFSPADLLQRVVVANTSNSVPAMQSTSSN